MDLQLSARSAIFKDLDSFQLEVVAGVSEVVELKVGEYVFRKGDEGDRLSIIEQGEVRISRVIPGTGEEASTLLKPGACFGVMAILDRSERSTDATASSRCVLLSISRANFEAMLEEARRFKRLDELVRDAGEVGRTAGGGHLPKGRPGTSHSNVGMGAGGVGGV